MYLEKDWDDVKSFKTKDDEVGKMVKNQLIGRKQPFQLFWKEKSDTEKKMLLDEEKPSMQEYIIYIVEINVNEQWRNEMLNIDSL